VSTNAGFAIGSPGTPRVVDASDHIRAAWVVTHNVYLNHYIHLRLEYNYRPVAICDQKVTDSY